MFITVLFINAKYGKQLKCLSTSDCIHSYNRKILSNKKESTTDMHNNMRTF